jgi:hypothetical protein
MRPDSRGCPSRPDPVGFFHLRLDCSFLPGASGLDPAGVDPTALLAPKSKRPALHHRRCGSHCERWNWNPAGFANCEDARLVRALSSGRRRSEPVNDLRAKAPNRLAIGLGVRLFNEMTTNDDMLEWTIAGTETFPAMITVGLSLMDWREAWPRAGGRGRQL